MYIVVGSYFTLLFPLSFSKRSVNHPHCYTYNPRFFLPRAIFFPYHSPRLVPYFSFLFLAIKILILFGYRFLFISVTVDLHQCIYNILYLYTYICFCCIEVVPGCLGIPRLGLARAGGRGWNFSFLASTPTSVAFFSLPNRPLKRFVCLSSSCFLPGWDAVPAFELCLSLRALFLSPLFVSSFH